MSSQVWPPTPKDHDLATGTFFFFPPIGTFELWCWRRLESPLGYKQIKASNPKGNQPWMFIGRTDAEAPILWPPDVRKWLTGKDPDAEKAWSQKKRVAEVEMIRHYHWLNGHEFELILGDSKDKRVWHAAGHGVAKSWTRLLSWTTKCQLVLMCAVQLGDVFDHVCGWKGSSTCGQAPIILTHYVNCPLTASLPDFWFRL